MREPRPTDTDAERLVLADALTEANDPRGELITLSIAHATSPEKTALAERIASLLDTEAPHLLGALHPNVQPITFNRGFLDHARLMATAAPSIEALVGQPEWSTVRALHVHPTGVDPDALTDLVRSCPALETLSGNLPANTLHALASGPPVGLTTLALGRQSLDLREPDDHTLREVFDGPGLSAVRSLSVGRAVRGGYDPSWIGATALGTRLQNLEVPAPFEELPAWFAAFTGPLGHLQSMRIHAMLGGNSWTITPTDSGKPALTAKLRLAILTIWRRSVRSDLAIAEVLDLLPVGSVESVNVEITGGFRATRSGAERLEDSIARVSRCDVP